jgi:hypothetical protein
LVAVSGSVWSDGDPRDKVSVKNPNVRAFWGLVIDIKIVMERLL